MITPHALLPLGPMARSLRVTSAWLRDEADAGRVPCLRAGTRYLFAPAAVESALAQRAAEERRGIRDLKSEFVETYSKAVEAPNRAT
jgi:hypothetical protein